MHDATQPELIQAISQLSRMLEIQKRAAAGVNALYATLEGQGFSRRSVDRAIDVMNADLDDEAADLKQTQAILAAMSSPVQIEMVGLIEAPITEAEHLDTVMDSGRWARMSGAARSYRGSFDRQEREAFMAGWDEMDAILAPIEEKDDGRTTQQG